MREVEGETTGTQETFEGNGSVHSLDHGGIYMCVETPDCTL